MKLIDVSKAFASDEQCLAYLEASRWPEGVRCPVCGAKEVSKITRKTVTKNKRAQVYQCLETTCKSQFSATNGTIFHDSHLPLSKWFMAIALLVDAKKSMSALQLSRHLACNYRTAWYLAHRIREAMIDNDGPKMTGVVEVDETYIGGKQRGFKGMRKNKDVVVGIRQRGGDLRLMHVENNTSAELGAQIRKNVSPDVKMIVTDELSAYPSAMISAGIHGSKHETIKHKDRVYVRGNVHTNTIESAFSLLKRGIIGSFHQVSIKHLQRYLNEFGYRFNRREAADIFEQTVSRLTAGKAMPYRKLVERNAFTPFVRP
jgi:transposase-like protein